MDYQTLYTLLIQNNNVMKRDNKITEYIKFGENMNGYNKYAITSIGKNSAMG